MKYRYLQTTGALQEGGTSNEAWSQSSAQTKSKTAAKTLGKHSRNSARQSQADRQTLLNIDADIIALLPESIAREHTILPIAFDGETILFASATDHDVMVADKLRFVLNRNVRFMVFPKQDVIAAINRHYGVTETRSVDSFLQEFTDSEVAFSPAPMTSRASAATDPRSQINSRDEVRRRREAGWDMARSSTMGASTALVQDSPVHWEHGMFFYVVEEGKQVLIRRPNGKMDVVVGPQRVWRGKNQFREMDHYVAHPGEFLILRFRDGTQKHLPGPAEVWKDPRVHLSISKEEALQIAAKEAVVVYSQSTEPGGVVRRVVTGPSLFIPKPGEWLHTFSWHSSKGGHKGIEKIPNGLVFQKLWLMPDQMYHDVQDVRTADDAVLTVRLMIFFELLDIDRMLKQRMIRSAIS